jgi:hypothetical protein
MEYKVVDDDVVLKSTVHPLLSPPQLPSFDPSSPLRTDSGIRP